jgi:hypothetical protein
VGYRQRGGQRQRYWLRGVGGWRWRGEGEVEEAEVGVGVEVEAEGG